MDYRIISYQPYNKTNDKYLEFNLICRTWESLNFRHSSVPGVKMAAVTCALSSLNCNYDKESHTIHLKTSFPNKLDLFIVV